MQPAVYTPSDPVSFQSVITFAQKLTASIFSTGLLGFIYVVLALTLLGLITLILFLFVRMYEIRKEAAAKKKPLVTPTALPTTSQAGVSGDIPLPVENVVWKGIRERLLSENSSDWKLAIIEADIYMDKVLDDKGFHGDTTGDKLKQITPDKLPSIQIAWEAHKVRNRIAHDGAAFVLTMPETRRLLSYFEIVFTDLGVL